MSKRYTTIYKLGAALAFCSFAGLVLAGLITRSPTTWLLLPDGLLQEALRWLAPSTQEEAADCEFTLLWVQMSICSAAILWLCRWSSEHAQQAPNPSIERTCPGKPGHASHVKR